MFGESKEKDEIAIEILRWCYSNGCDAGAHEIEKQTKVYFNIEYVGELVIEGDWTSLYSYIDSFISWDNNHPEVKSLLLKVPEHQILESMSIGNRDKAKDVIRERISPKSFQVTHRSLVIDKFNLLIDNYSLHNDKKWDVEKERHNLSLFLQTAISSILGEKTKFPQATLKLNIEKRKEKPNESNEKKGRTNINKEDTKENENISNKAPPSESEETWDFHNNSFNSDDGQMNKKEIGALRVDNMIPLLQLIVPNKSTAKTAAMIYEDSVIKKTWEKLEGVAKGFYPWISNCKYKTFDKEGAKRFFYVRGTVGSCLSSSESDSERNMESENGKRKRREKEMENVEGYEKATPRVKRGNQRKSASLAKKNIISKYYPTKEVAKSIGDVWKDPRIQQELAEIDPGLTHKEFYSWAYSNLVKSVEAGSTLVHCPPQEDSCQSELSDSEFDIFLFSHSTNSSESPKKSEHELAAKNEAEKDLQSQISKKELVNDEDVLDDFYDVHYK